MSAWPRRACVASRPRISFGSGFAAALGVEGAAAGVEDVVPAGVVAGGVAAATDEVRDVDEDESSVTRTYAKGPATASTSTATATYGAADRTRPGRGDLSVGA